MATILLVDDDQFNRNGIGLFLKSEGYEILEAGDEETGWRVFKEAMPQPVAAIVDISIPPDPRTPSRPSHNFGISLAQRIKAAEPVVGVVLFSAYEDRADEIFELVKAGTRGLAYKVKGSQPSSLLSAIGEVLAGGVLIDPEVQANRHKLADELRKRLTADERPRVEQAVASIDDLTPREKEIARRVAASHNTEGIAKSLMLEPKSVENHITRIYDKLGLNEMARVAPHLRKVVVLAKAFMIYDLQ